MTFLKRRRVTTTLLLLITAVAFLLTRAPDDPLQAAAVTNPPFTSLTYGIQAFLWWDYTKAAMDLDRIHRMVFSHVKQVFAWGDIEPAPGEWHFSRADEILGEIERRDLKLVVRLSDAPDWAHPTMNSSSDLIDTPPDSEFLQAWAGYCGAVASRYPGRVAAYQIWNEPNLAREWGGRTPNATEYVELLRVCSQAIRAADPKAILISAGLSPTGTCCDVAIPDDQYLQAMYDAGFQQYIDVVGMHAPGYSKPQLSPDEARHRFFSFRRVEDLRKIMVANGDAARQAAILEFGWTTDPGMNPDYAWYAVSEAEQARYMVEAYQYAADHWRPWVGLMSAIYIADPAWTENDEEYWWGITLPNGAARQAYFDLANMAKYCGERIIPARAGDSPEALGLVSVDPCD